MMNLEVSFLRYILQKGSDVGRIGKEVLKKAVRMLRKGRDGCIIL